MTDYRAVMTLLIQQRSYRQIEDQLGCSHRAISRANHALRSLGLTTIQQVAALTNDELDEIFVDNRSSGQGEFVPINFDAVVKARAGRTKQTLQLLWARYTSIPAQAGQRHYSYDRFRQLVAPMLMQLGLPPVSPIHQGIRCRWIGLAPRCACTTPRANWVRKSAFSSPRCRIQGCSLRVRALTSANNPGLMPTAKHLTISVGSARLLSPNWGLCIAVWFSLWMLCHFSSSALHK